MRGWVAAFPVAFGLVLPGACLAEDSPWKMIREMFQEPAMELKQQFRQLRVPTAPAPKVEKGSAAGSAKAPDKAPKPERRPEPESEPEAASVQDLTTAPIPRPRPEIAIPYAADEPSPPASDSVAAIGALTPPERPLIVPPPAARSTCRAALAKLGVEADAIAPIREGSCGIAEPVAIAALGAGATDLTTKAIIECNLAETFATWLRDEVQPQAQKILGGEVTGLRIAASYHCRSRNGVRGAKLSEHGRGNAIDISAFRIGKRGWIEVGGGHSNDEARFLKAIRTAACGTFTTVLGPGSDAYHSDHLHLDLAKRNRNGKSRGLYCQ